MAADGRATWAAPSRRQRSHDPIRRSSNDRLVSQQPLADTTAHSLPHDGFLSDETSHLRRRSSLAERLGSITEVGGVNSLSNFARSWQRAASFFEVTPGPRSIAFQTEQPLLDEAVDEELHHHHQHQPQHRYQSLLRIALENERRGDESAVDEVESLFAPPQFPALDENVRRRLSERHSRLFDEHRHDTLSTVGSIGSYGSIAQDTPPPRIFSNSHISSLAELLDHSNDDTASLLVKQVADGEGKSISVIVGQSTLPQTIFNSCNVLMGVGILALPLAIRYSGWLIGMTFFLASAVVTGYTAKLLAKCLDVDSSLITFADLAYVSFGTRARIAVSILFSLELLASCVALVIIFADSLNALFTQYSVLQFKLICGIITVPLAFAPLRLLSFTSIAGILSCLVIVVAIITDGFVKDHALGSLREPATTYLFPANWNTLPLALGLLMAPWGGHSVFPNVYRDMRHPYKYSRAVNVTYIFTYVVEAALAIAGYLMFGEHTRDEITANIFEASGYPRWLSIFILIAISIIPLTKLPLNARPIVSTIELFAGLDPRQPLIGTMADGTSQSWLQTFAKTTIRVMTIALFVVVAILVPSFDRIMSLLGSAACFTVCVILPCAFHLKIFGKDLSLAHRALDWTLIIVCSVLAVVGTIFSFIPKALLGLG